MTGPATFSMWKACFAILVNAMIMLGAADLGNLIDYGRYFERFYARFGEKAYPLMYQADVRTRWHFSNANPGDVADPLL